jgi:hypothetical protein
MPGLSRQQGFLMSDDQFTLDLEDMDDLGEFATFEAYARSMLDPVLLWVLDYLDYAAVQTHMEEQGVFAFHRVGGRLYRETLD